MGEINFVKRVRLQALMSQADFAKAIGVSFCTVNRWENKRNFPGYKALKKIKKFCKDNNIDVGIDWSKLEEME